MASSPRVTVTKDSVARVVASINTLAGKQVLIGIPEDTTGREERGPITNAVIGYLMEFGSPASNVPARPSLIPGVEKAQQAELEQLQKAATAGLGGNMAKAEKHLNAAGVIAAASVKREITTGDFVPLGPATIRSRRYARKTQSMRESESVYLELIDAGVDRAAAQAEVDIRPLINTGQFRNAVTSVVRTKQ